MSKFSIETYNLDITDPIFVQCAEWVANGEWYIGHKKGNHELNPDPSGMRGTLTRDGKHNIPPSAESMQKKMIAGVWRQPYGWDDESTRRRAPLVYKLFELINQKYFDSKFTLDGFGEEIGGTQWMMDSGDDPTIPYYHSRFPKDIPQIWTSYCTGRTGGIRSIYDKPMGMKGKAFDKSLCGAHMDSPYTDDRGNGYYSLTVVLNPTWKQSWGGELIFHDDATGDCELHEKRGYGIGYARELYPNEPGLVTLYPAKAIHSSTDKKFLDRNEYQRRLMFRCKEK